MSAIDTRQLMNSVDYPYLRICFVGLGLGSHIVDAIGRELAARRSSFTPIITLIDGDSFTVKKGDHESFHREGPKVEVKAEQLRLILPSAKVVPIGRELWRHNTKRLLENQDFIIAFTDVNNMKFYLSRWVEHNKRDVVLITGGIYTDEGGGFVRAHLRSRGTNLTPGVAHGVKTHDRVPTINRNERGYVAGRDTNNEHRRHRNLLMTAVSSEVLQLFADIIDGRLYYDTVELERSDIYPIERVTYFHEEVYRT